ncbi:MAG: metallophosphoesterase [Firmicutes bacterium]|nr:metallophosphoesterase [Bacillota bacterium]
MRILAVSDTHGDCSRVIDIYQKLSKESPVDVIVHCGDYAADARELQTCLGVHVAWVRGNCDGGFSDTDWSVLETEAGNFLVTHGHMEQVDYSKQKVYYKALENHCVGAFFGHTHRASYTEVDGVALMNPGSLTKPRDGSGGTFGLMVTHEDGIWGKIYRYEDFMASGGSNGGSQNGAQAQKPKVRGGHLRDLLNYSDRF